MQAKLSRTEWQLLAATVCAAGVAVFGPALAQHPHYHAFADHRAAWGVPSALNVLSNLPFALGGLWGLARVGRHAQVQPLDRRWGLAALFFVGLVATALGSGVYHWAPTDVGLTLDRLGMVVAFAGLAGMAAADRISERSGVWVAAGLAAVGPLAACWWLYAGNLLPWAVLQGGGLLLITALAFRRPAEGAWNLPWAKVVGLYLLAKVFEMADHAVLDLTLGLISGHTLKHVVAAAVVLPLFAAMPKLLVPAQRVPSAARPTSV
ncbi:hypothetical protein [Rhodoferax sp.]|jgi:hypothetical protein|uniref:hypothetical protein n=1 Tax=Rhodoferax sp. TaxID=50421 RepID=UPI0037851E24